MKYLCRLVTPKHGIIYDPFSESGSTGKGARLEAFNIIGSELDKDYCEIANKRINSEHDLINEIPPEIMDEEKKGQIIMDFI